MNYILNLLSNKDAVKCILEHKNGLGNLSICEEALLLASSFQKQPQSMFVIKKNTYQAQKLYEALSELIGEHTLLFTCEESLRIEAIAQSPEARVSQLETMSKLCSDKPYIVVCNVIGATRFQPSKEIFNEHVINLKIDQEITIEKLKKLLMEAGYSHATKVDQPLNYASRGGIVDVFSINYEHPIRIEFFDTMIDSIRFFDISSQRTIETVNEITILPANTLLFTKEEISEIVEEVLKEIKLQKEKMKLGYYDILNDRIQEDLDKISNYANDAYLYRYYAFLKHKTTIVDYKKDALIIHSSLDENLDMMKRIKEESITYIQELYYEGIALPRFNIYKEVEQLNKQRKMIEFKMFQDYKNPIATNIMVEEFNGLTKEALIGSIKLEASKKRILICLEKDDIKEIEEVFTDIKEISCDEEISYGISYVDFAYKQSFRMIDEDIVVYSSKELLKKRKIFTRYASKFNELEVLKSYQELHVGDFVVHHRYGIGKYLGIDTRKENNVHKDYLKIAYRGDDLLFVPVEHFDYVRKFVSKEGVSPKLNKLGSNEWEKTKKKVGEKVAELAERLVNLYAVREDNIGHAFEADDELQAAFEEDFEYNFTSDQARAIMEIKKDMQSAKPMDRLLCGDVGFGKTEVAACAVFKAVSQGKQAAFLCPTTILSRQHYHTFKHRFRNFPIRIEMINRFVSAKEVKLIARDLKEGKIDILIGTHKLLGKQIEFKDLGILIIDEEQRFGVSQKEKIKELKNGIDVLSLSATPIPRTMQMSLVGVRSLSHLDTPPRNRLPVQTYVIEKNYDMVKEIIERELARDGQVFYLFNNIDEIYGLAKILQDLLPGVKIGIAHGRMNREDIEDMMMAFTDKEYQVLLCTTIIETGIDIPNANTMIIDQADRFGLAQLYQIKGRVGRSDRLAYAYLMYSPNKQLSEGAEKRLKAIKEFTQLGSGYKIAMRDLTIRGAGDMLGPKQSGFIDTVGLDMYMEMLNDAILEKKGIKKEEPIILKKANVKLDAYIPEQFEKEDFEKLTLYQKINAIINVEQLIQVFEEVQDLYGKLPNNVRLLFDKKVLDILISKPYVASFKDGEKAIEVTFNELFSNNLDGVAFFETMSNISRSIQLKYEKKCIIIRLPKKNWLNTVIEILKHCDTMYKE